MTKRRLWKFHSTHGVFTLVILSANKYCIGIFPLFQIKIIWFLELLIVWGHEQTIRYKDMQRLIQKGLELIKDIILLNHFPSGNPAASRHSSSHLEKPMKRGTEALTPSHHQLVRNVDEPSWN